MKRVVSRHIVHGALALGGAAFLIGTAFAVNSSGGSHSELKPPPLNLKVDEAPVNRGQDMKRSYAPIVAKVAPSVVKIFVSSSVPDRNLSGQDPEFFRHFFGDIPWPSGPMLEHGLGSGVIVSSE